MEKGKQLLGGGANGGGWRSKLPSLVKLPKLGSGADLRQAMSEKVLSFWQQNRHIIIGAAFSVAVYYVWRTTYGIASMFIDLTETFAELGFLALAVALAGAGCLWIRERARINPDKLFRLAMTRLNTSPSVLGVMGAPLTGSHLQVSPRDGTPLRGKTRGSDPPTASDVNDLLLPPFLYLPAAASSSWLEWHWNRRPSSPAAVSG